MRRLPSGYLCRHDWLYLPGRLRGLPSGDLLREQCVVLHQLFRRLFWRLSQCLLVHDLPTGPVPGTHRWHKLQGLPGRLVFCRRFNFRRILLLPHPGTFTAAHSSAYFGTFAAAVTGAFS